MLFPSWANADGDRFGDRRDAALRYAFMDDMLVNGGVGGVDYSRSCW